jgi:hypothetical protein
VGRYPFGRYTAECPGLDHGNGRECRKQRKKRTLAPFLPIQRPSPALLKLRKHEFEIGGCHKRNLSRLRVSGVIKLNAEALQLNCDFLNERRVITGRINHIALDTG